jgi:UDP-N-acetylglucosamine:LPS N-acetylglucosamine transferase
MPAINWQVFSKNSKKDIQIKNTKITPINTELFLKSMASAEGVLCNAGFGTASEALFLKKKLLVIPMKKQLEQAYNAAMLEEMGVSVIKKLNNKNIPKIKKWLDEDTIVTIDYPDNTEEIVSLIVTNHAGNKKFNTNGTLRLFGVSHCDPDFGALRLNSFFKRKGR